MEDEGVPARATVCLCKIKVSLEARESMKHHGGRMRSHSRRQVEDPVESRSMTLERKLNQRRGAERIRTRIFSDWIK